MKFLLGILILSGASVQAAEQPNILFIAIDDMNDWTGFLGGHPQAQTPNMDRLARKGVSFTNAHCSAPGCSPSRNALLFGTEPFHSGLYAFYDHAGFSDKVLRGCTTIPELLRANGYNTYGSGKIHHRREPTPKEWTEFHKPEPHQLVYQPEEGYHVGPYLATVVATLYSLRQLGYVALWSRGDEGSHVNEFVAGYLRLVNRLGAVAI